MKAVITRVTNASVSVDSNPISTISHGLLVLIGISSQDTPADVQTLTKKILSLRLWPSLTDGTDWRANVQDVKGEILAVSQFTLLAKVAKGTKPDFHGAMNPTEARKMYESCLEALGKGYEVEKIKDGRFGAMMQVASTNDGPITIIYDTRAPPSTPSTSGASTPLSGLPTSNAMVPLDR